MTLVHRDRAAEADTLDRIGRLSRNDSLPRLVGERLDHVEAQGGPDTHPTTSGDRVRGAHEEAIDGTAWVITALHQLQADLHGRHLDAFTYDQTSIALQDAMVSFAHAEQALRGALTLLGEQS